MDITLALSVIEKAITSGQILKTEITVDGNTVKFNSLTEQLKYYEYLKNLAALEDTSSSYARGRVVVGDTGDGSR